jgi:SP family general alpha glucoside:H+ symporter-like MFS transporter
MLTPDGWNWGARSGLFWFGTNVLSLIYTYYRLPETKGRTYGELDILFFRKTPARQFKTTSVNGEPISLICVAARLTLLY